MSTHYLVTDAMTHRGAPFRKVMAFKARRDGRVTVTSMDQSLAAEVRGAQGRLHGGESQTMSAVKARKVWRTYLGFGFRRVESIALG